MVKLYENIFVSPLIIYSFHHSSKPRIQYSILLVLSKPLRLTSIQHPLTRTPQTPSINRVSDGIYNFSPTCSSRALSTCISHSNSSLPPSIVTLLLFPLTFRTFLLQISPKYSTSPSGLPPTRHTKPCQVYTRGQVISVLSPPTEISLPSPSSFSLLLSLYLYEHWRAKKTWYTTVSHYYLS